jgi:HEAT repeat protein
MEIEKKIAEIIPPNNYTNRHDFSNDHLIDKLSDKEKTEIESALISKLYSDPVDILVVETLAYMKSDNAIPALLNSLENCKIEIQKVIIAISIYKIKPNHEMIEVAIDAVKEISDDRDLIVVFSYLMEFKSERINNLIQNYINHPDFLVSYNAKRALGMIS